MPILPHEIMKNNFSNFFQALFDALFWLVKNCSWLENVSNHYLKCSKFLITKLKPLEQFTQNYVHVRTLPLSSIFFIRSCISFTFFLCLKRSTCMYIYIIYIITRKCTHVCVYTCTCTVHFKKKSTFISVARN